MEFIEYKPPYSPDAPPPTYVPTGPAHFPSETPSSDKPRSTYAIEREAIDQILVTSGRFFIEGDTEPYPRMFPTKMWTALRQAAENGSFGVLFTDGDQAGTYRVFTSIRWEAYLKSEPRLRSFEGIRPKWSAKSRRSSTDWRALREGELEKRRVGRNGANAARGTTSSLAGQSVGEIMGGENPILTLDLAFSPCSEYSETHGDDAFMDTDMSKMLQGDQETPQRADY